MKRNHWDIGDSEKVSNWSNQRMDQSLTANNFKSDT